MFEFENDAAYTKLLIVIKQVPCLILTLKQQRCHIQLATATNALIDVLEPTGYDLNTVDDYERLPEPVKCVITALLQQLLEFERKGECPYTLLCDYQKDTA
jgi:hypothetical protein